MKSLAKINYLETAVIRDLRVSEEVRLVLEELGIRERTSLMVKHQAPFSGPVILQVEGQDIALDHQIVEQIWVD